MQFARAAAVSPLVQVEAECGCPSRFYVSSHDPLCELTQAALLRAPSSSTELVSQKIQRPLSIYAHLCMCVTAVTLTWQHVKNQRQDLGVFIAQIEGSTQRSLTQVLTVVCRKTTGKCRCLRATHGGNCIPTHNLCVAAHNPNTTFGPILKERTQLFVC